MCKIVAMELYITYRNSRIYCQRTGTGRNIVFCFHGYGENSNTFQQLAASLEDTHSVFTFDLPLHGKTEWNEGDTCTPAMWHDIIHQCNPDKRPVTLLGYSIGGRIALSLYQYNPDTCKKLVLIAPDGLHVNFWYWFSTQTWLGNRFFRHTVNNPRWIFGLVTFAWKIRLINKAMYKVTHYYIDDVEQRKMLYARWTVLRRFRPSLAEIKTRIVARDTIVKLLFGKYDKIILSSHGQRFAKTLEKQATLRIMEAGHQLLKEKNIPVIAQLVVEEY